MLAVNNLSCENIPKIYNLEVDWALNSENISGLLLKQVQGAKGDPADLYQQFDTLHKNLQVTLILFNFVIAE